MRPPPPVTIREVAKAAGVSIATVSRVMNGDTRVAEEMRAHVRGIVEQMGYAPHGGVRPVARHTRTLGVLLPALYGEFFSEFLRGIDETARAHDFLTLVTSARSDAPAIAAAVRNMRGRVDGFLALSPSVSARATLAGVADRYPTVLVGAGSDVGAFAALSVNNFQGAADMMKHLLAIGHRRILFVRGPDGQVDAAERLHAVREVAAWHADCSLREIDGAFRQDVAYEALLMLLRETPPEARPHAIICANDTMAIGALAAVRDVDLHVPDDSAVTGFDDIPVARYLTPPLTTVRFPIYTLGERAALRLIETLKAGGTTVPTSHDILPTPLVIRSSCGATRRLLID